MMCCGLDHAKKLAERKTRRHQNAPPHHRADPGQPEGPGGSRRRPPLGSLSEREASAVVSRCQIAASRRQTPQRSCCFRNLLNLLKAAPISTEPSAKMTRGGPSATTCIASSPLSRRSRPINVAHRTEPTAHSQNRPFVQFMRSSPSQPGNQKQRCLSRRQLSTELGRGKDSGQIGLDPHQVPSGLERPRNPQKPWNVAKFLSFDTVECAAKSCFFLLQKSVAKVKSFAMIFATNRRCHAGWLCSGIHRRSGSHPSAHSAEGRRVQAHL